jgi:hypothetical protein
VQDLRFRANDLLADAKLTAGGQAESDAAGLGARCPLEPPGSVFNGKAKHAVWWQALRAAGVPIVASWLDQPFNHDGGEPSADEWSAHWDRCCREAAEADIVLMYAGAEERQNGALIEVGAALGAGKRARARLVGTGRGSRLG